MSYGIYIKALMQFAYYSEWHFPPPHRMKSMSPESPEIRLEIHPAVEARAFRANEFRSHAFTCTTCQQNEEQLCPEGHRLLIVALSHAAR